MNATPRAPRLWEALVPIVIAAALVSSGIVFLRDEAPVPILLLLACIAPSVLALRLGLPWSEVEDGLVKGMTLALKAAVILLVVGTTIGTWAASGTVAALVSYGLEVLSPNWFLPASCFICAVVSLATGSSWSTAATVGVALMGIGHALDISPGMTAGAIISGAYFGDKMSPLSDTTNLAPGIAGATLFEHIHAMLYTTVPALLIALVVYTGIGFLSSTHVSSFDSTAVENLQHALANSQRLSPWLMLPPVLVIGLALLRVPAVPALLASTALGGVMAWLFQGQHVGQILSVCYSGFTSSTGHVAVDKLLSRGGMSGMFDTIALILCATAFGGVMERAGFIQALLDALLKKVHSVRGLIASTLGASVGMNFLLADQYLAIVLPGRMFRDTYPRFGLAPRMLSRTLEDAGTVTSALCPWNSCGAFMSATLGVATFTYAPWAILNYLIPLIALFYAWTGLFIFRLPPDVGGASAEAVSTRG
ncbi:MAG: Na+/H+ antiporter NhaC [Pseudomonadota bacterium]